MDSFAWECKLVFDDTFTYVNDKPEDNDTLLSYLNQAIHRKKWKLLKPFCFVSTKWEKNYWKYLISQSVIDYSDAYNFHVVIWKSSVGMWLLRILVEFPFFETFLVKDVS